MSLLLESHKIWNNSNSTWNSIPRRSVSRCQGNKYNQCGNRHYLVFSIYHISNCSRQICHYGKAPESQNQSLYTVPISGICKTDSIAYKPIIHYFNKKYNITFKAYTLIHTKLNLNLTIYSNAISFFLWA